MTFVFDPRSLISAPFISCPNCGADQFGILIVDAGSYSRACRVCWHRGARIALPPLTRKVIYVDQFAVSDMMKTLNSAHPAHERAKANSFWVDLFSLLDRLIRLQLVVCPFSDVHVNESVVTRAVDADALRDMYEYLSLMVGFDAIGTIAERQVTEALEAWLDGREPDYDFSPSRATTGGIDDWKESVRISVRSRVPRDVVDSIRMFRDGVRVKVEGILAERAQQARREPFERWYRHERHVGARAVVQAGELFYRRMEEIAAGRAERPYNSVGWKYFRLIWERLERMGGTEPERARQMAHFLASDAYKDVPAHRIQALVWAAIDQAISGGQRNLDVAGMSNDIQALTLMPFCDAMLIDNACRSMWNKIPERFRPGYARAKLFSCRSSEDFLEYLRDIETQAHPTVTAAARDVYGDPQPFLDLYSSR